MEIHDKMQIFIFFGVSSFLLPPPPTPHTHTEWRPVWWARVVIQGSTPKSHQKLSVRKTNVVHNTAIDSMTRNPKVSQNFKLLGVMVEYVSVLCSVCLFQAGCSKRFVLLLGLLESNKHSYSGQKFHINKGCTWSGHSFQYQKNIALI